MGGDWGNTNIREAATDNGRSFEGLFCRPTIVDDSRVCGRCPVAVADLEGNGWGCRRSEPYNMDSPVCGAGDFL